MVVLRGCLERLSRRSRPPPAFPTLKSAVYSPTSSSTTDTSTCTTTTGSRRTATWSPNAAWAPIVGAAVDAFASPPTDATRIEATDSLNDSRKMISKTQVTGRLRYLVGAMMTEGIIGLQVIQEFSKTVE